MGLRHKDRVKKHGRQEPNHSLAQHSRTEKKGKGETASEALLEGGCF